MKTQYTTEDVKWAKEKILPMTDGNPTPHTLEVKGVMELFKKRFGRSISSVGLSTWLRRVQNPQRQKEYDRNYRERLKSGVHVPRSRNPVAIFEKSNFIVVVGHNVAGFETKEEVQAFLAQSQILSGVKLFANTPIKVKYKVTIGK